MEDVGNLDGQWIVTKKSTTWQSLTYVAARYTNIRVALKQTCCCTNWLRGEADSADYSVPASPECYSGGLLHGGEVCNRSIRATRATEGRPDCSADAGRCWTRGIG